MECAKERPTLQCCAKSQSARYWLDIISGDIFKMVLDIYICRHWKPGWLETGQVGDKVGGVTTGGQWTASSGPDGTDDGGCERDWGFETHSRRTFTRLSHSEASETALGEVGNTDRHPTTDGHRRPSDGRLGEHFHFHTTRLKGFSSTETPHFDLPWNLPDRGQLLPKRETMLWSGSFP